MTVTQTAGGTGKTNKKKAAKKPKAAKKIDLAKLLNEKIAELPQASKRHLDAKLAWEEAHAHAGELKKAAERRQADINGIVADIVAIKSGTYQIPLPFGEVPEPATPDAPDVTKKDNRPTGKVKMLKAVKTKSIDLIIGQIVEAKTEEATGITTATDPQNGNQIVLEADEYEHWHGDDVAPAENPGQEAWRKVALDTLLKGSLLEKLAQAGVNTIGDVVDLESQHKRLIDLKGIGEGAAAKVADAIADYFKSHA